VTLILAPGVLVDHTTWGRGKVVELVGAYVTVYFPSLTTSSAGPRRKLQTGATQLSISSVQSDPNLDLVSIGPVRVGKKGAAKAKATHTQIVHTLEQAVLWFQTAYPTFFQDPDLTEHELVYKRAAHDLWVSAFGEGRAETLLGEQQFPVIAKGLNDLYKATNIPSRYEIMAASDGLKDHAAAARLLRANLAFLARPCPKTFPGLVEAVGSLPAPPGGTRVLTWPNITIVPFLAEPGRFMVVKPEITQLIASRMGVDIFYSSAPTWHSYEAILAMSERLLDRLRELGARDYIDVQSFMWVTRELN
jgi:hypothetical protein